MKFIAFAVAASTLSFAATASAAPAVPSAPLNVAPASPYAYQLGVVSYREQYEEFTDTGKLMQEVAVMNGLRGSMSRKVSGTDGTVTLAEEIAFGKSVYTGSYWGGQYGDLTVSGIRRVMFDINLSYKHAAPAWNGVTADVGLGYRRLVDQLQDAGPGGYPRLNERFYLAFGLEKPFQAHDWTITPSAKYKHSLRSRQWSGLGEGVTVKQPTGHGAELAVSFVREGFGSTVTITPFYRTWVMKDSEISPSMLYEPRNKTTESGVSLTVQF